MTSIILILILICGIAALIMLSRPKKKKTAVVTKRSMTAMSKLAMVEADVKSLIVAIDDDRSQGGSLIGWMQKDRFYIESLKATVKASVNMEDFSEEQIQIDPIHNTITLKLPLPTVEKANILQEDSNVIWKKGDDFSIDELFRFRRQKQAEIDKDPKIHRAIIEQAKQNTEEFFTAWLKTMGYADANILFEKK